jgi:hypothetical protein
LIGFTERLNPIIIQTPQKLRAPAVFFCPSNRKTREKASRAEERKQIKTKSLPLGQRSASKNKKAFSRGRRGTALRWMRCRQG